MERAGDGDEGAGCDAPEGMEGEVRQAKITKKPKRTPFRGDGGRLRADKRLPVER